ncbi:hypothetical protein E2C05_11525 [Paracraurococcus ruber]|nr:hypothetical protein E2C05_11525 [Paracraurococcus ruber]
MQSPRRRVRSTGLAPGRPGPSWLALGLLLAAILAPPALILIERAVPPPLAEIDRLGRLAAKAADAVAALLAQQAATPRRAEDAPRNPAAPPATADAAPREPAAVPMPWTHLALQGVEPDLASLGAALAMLAPRDGIRIALLAPDGQVLLRSGAGTEPEQGVLVVRRAVPGWPLQVAALQAPPATPSVLPFLAVAALALLLLAGFALRWDRRIRATAAAALRDEALRRASLAESTARQRLALGAAGLGCWSWDEAADEVTWDASAAAILGWQPACLARGDALRQRLDPADAPLLQAALEQGRRSGEPTQCTLRLRATPGLPQRWIELRIQAWPGPRGILWHGVIGDATARREAEEAQQRLLHEVDHRARNALAVVQALLRLSRGEPPAGLLPRVEARIAALARAHTLLAQSRWEGADLRRLATAELNRQGPSGQRAQLAGPPVLLSPLAAQPMAMVLHELASNAARHGALAAPGGSLSLTWRWLPEGGLDLAWQETLAVPQPRGRAPAGFGTRILDATIRDQLGGRIAREWRAEGLRCSIGLPAGCLVAAPALLAAE